VSVLLLDYVTLTLKSQFAVNILIGWIEELAESTFLTNDEIRSRPTVLNLGIEMATGLLIVGEIKDVIQTVQELGLTGVGCTVNEYAVSLVLRTEDEIFTDVFDEAGMVRTVHGLDNLLHGLRIITDLINEIFQILTGIR